MSITPIWLMRVITVGSMVVGAIIGYSVAIITIILVVVIMRLVAKKRRRDEYNLEYPADFQSSADEDMRDRFSGRHYK